MACTAAAGAAVRTIRLENAGPAEVSRELSQALGVPVEVQGGMGRRVSLELPVAAPNQVLDRAAAELRGAWKMKLRVKAGGAADPAAGAALESPLTLGLQEIPASRAFALVARHLKADLEAEGDLTTRVSVLAVNSTTGSVLDQVARQARAAWSVAYVIQSPDLKPTSSSVPAPQVPPIAQVVPLTAPQAPSIPVVAPPSVPPPAAAVRARLWEAVRTLVRANSAQRAAAVQEFLHAGEQLTASLAPLSATERAERLRAALPVLSQWRRLYQGLTPNVARELAPASDFLERTLHP